MQAVPAFVGWRRSCSGTLELDTRATAEGQQKREVERGMDFADRSAPSRQTQALSIEARLRSNV